jgi:HEAT repeat protein
MIGVPVLDVALIVLGALLLGGLALLVAHGTAVAAVSRLRGRRVAAARAAILTAARHGRADETAERALAAIPPDRALAVLDELAPSLAGPEREALDEIARRRGLIAHAEARCGARRWRTRLHAARVLALHGGGERTVPPLLDDARPEVRAQAAEWAAGISVPTHPALAERLVAMLEDPAPFPRYTAMDALVRLRAAGVEALGRSIAGGGPRAALEVAARIGDARLAEPAEARLDDPDPAVRAWAVRILGALGGERHAAAVVARLADPAAQVRAAAAVALGRLGHWPAATALAERLRDDDWQVRHDASLALRVLGPAGQLLLQRALRDEDAFARDMARQTLDLPEAGLPA